MIEISIALVLIAAIAGYLVNRYLDQRQQEMDHKNRVNIEADNTAAIAALTEQINKFDERINSTWGTISSTKQELEAFKLQIGLRNRT
jgi:C4-dicarboxylate transporter